MFHPPAAAGTLPTFDALLAGPADDDGEAVDSTVANAYVWRTRAWLPPTKHQRKDKTPRPV